MALEHGNKIKDNYGLEMVLDKVHVGDAKQNLQKLVYVSPNRQYIQSYYESDLFVHGGPRTVFTDADKSAAYYDLCKSL